MTDTRVADTPTLVGILENAERAGLRQTLSPTLRRALDTFGYHVLTITRAWHEGVGSGDETRHHRTLVILKRQGSGTPHTETLDVLPEDWQRLPSADQVLRAQRFSRELNT